MALKSSLFLIPFLLLLLSSVTNVTTSSRANRCPQHFDEIGGACYLFSESMNLRLDWDGAREWCRRSSSAGVTVDLLTLDVVPYSSLFDVFLYIAAREYVLEPTYLGAHEESDRENTWNWTTGSNLSLLHPLWDCNFPFQPTGLEDCGHLVFVTERTGTTRLKLRNNECHVPQHFVCAETTTTLPTSQSSSHTPGPLLSSTPYTP